MSILFLLCFCSVDNAPGHIIIARYDSFVFAGRVFILSAIAQIETSAAEIAKSV